MYFGFVSWLHLCFLVSQHAPVLMFLRLPAVHPALIWSHWERIPKLQDFLFIYLSIQLFFHAVALFPNLTNVLELIEYDPLTAVWNNEASFPHIFSLRMAPLSCTSVHIKVPYQCGIWGWRNYWSHWEPPYLLLLHWGRDGWLVDYGASSHAFRVRRQWSDSLSHSFGFYFFLDNCI